MRPFKRNKIENDAHPAWTVWYIHNPLHHNYAKSLDEWKFSSYRAIGSPKTKTASKKVLDFFGGSDNFIKFHQIQNNGYYDSL